MYAYLGIGTNLGNKTANINTCLHLIKEYAGSIVRRSTIYESAPWGFRSDNAFLNIAVCIDTPFSPLALLNATQQIERRMGRTEKSVNGIYHDRIIDIDILLYENLLIDTPTLQIPHPHIAERDFVRIPLQEILQPDHIFSVKNLQE
ncbi:MAG: 2-amino-4-hydroxy-6-hydroxymethyldihydropteridine diphosphokinase [Bacteroides sp.]|nr:2-amino-4-hydroxy-6-hydroxymethyldihydropteridine diphosphokinase [Bacteroidales bacterium]MCM1068810.1 2-amino-4-hydroxy-6-hydroxymethyldihydropteridine diphosphokinase [Prevotella sp.]MCM1353951.1 2-amino-4-hydroxy-6-hydroxymethyldihydropteridine diphosphokinase [Bacteroides sp.]MCM1403215.1 2-amino-4-hydroxy-6-hydroxymethyldihydropteridine diphosphokinase [Bacteroides sp.]MCM1443349.1 2-amino-4-hydroxy-6-hydroxymethyldihydropteridine diphosphokinase [Muribaculum sp.]